MCVLTSSAFRSSGRRRIILIIRSESPKKSQLPPTAAQQNQGQGVHHHGLNQFHHQQNEGEGTRSNKATLTTRPCPSKQQNTTLQQLWEQLPANQQLAQQAVVEANRQMQKHPNKLGQQQQPLTKKNLRQGTSLTTRQSRPTQHCLNTTSVSAAIH